MKFLFFLFTLFSGLFAETYPIVVVGGGIGALTSSLYLARAGLSPLVLEGKTPGGLLTQSHAVGNWPGEMEIEGFALTDKVRAQAIENGAQFRAEEVVKVDFSKRPFTLWTKAIGGEAPLQTIQAESVILALGTTPNLLHVPGESEYWGRGVTNCAICDGSLFRDQVVGVVGGGDAAVLEALYLSNLAKEVHVFVRKGALRALESKRVQTLLAKPNVKILYDTRVTEVQGDGKKVTGVLLQTATTRPKIFALDGLFLAIGSTPNSAIFQNVLKLDGQGYIVLEKDQQTSIPGVYAIGDIVDPVYKQAISAAGDGAKAALQAQKYLSDRIDGLVAKKELVEITSAEQFEQELRSAKKPVVVDFYANWCGPCRQISPMIEKSAEALAGKVKFLKVNADKLGSLVRSYEIRAMPTVLLFDPAGQIVQRKVGSDQISFFLKDLEKK